MIRGVNIFFVSGTRFVDMIPLEYYIWTGVGNGLGIPPPVGKGFSGFDVGKTLGVGVGVGVTPGSVSHSEQVLSAVPVHTLHCAAYRPNWLGTV